MERLGEEDPREIGGYRLLGRLGAGGMGRVYLAGSPGHRKVALKVIHPHLAREPGFRTRFIREVETARRVSGAFTASVVDADPDAEIPWMATEYLAGPTLRQAVRETGPLAGAELRSLAAALAEALAGIHEAGLVHRDLKPGNIVLAADGPRVIDFGIAKVLDSVEGTHTARGFGTLAYVSPEQALGGVATSASDVFSLGSVLVYAATGEPPFGTAPQAAVIHRIVDREPDLEHLEEGLRAPLASLLAKDPDERPSSREAVGSLGGAPESVEWEPGGAVDRLVADSEHETARLTGSLPEPVPPTERRPEKRPGLQNGARPRGNRRARVLALGGIGMVAVMTVALVASPTFEGASAPPDTEIEATSADDVEYPVFPLDVLEPAEATPLDVEFAADVVRAISPSGRVFAWAPPDELEPVHFVSLGSAGEVRTFGNNRTREVPRRLAVADAIWFWGTAYEDGSSLVNRVTYSDPELSSGGDHHGYTAVGMDSAGGVPVVGTGDGRFGTRFGENRLEHDHRDPDGSRALPSPVDTVAVDREGVYMASAAAVGDDRNIRVVPLEGSDSAGGDDLYIGPEQVGAAEAMPTGEAPDGSPGGPGEESGAGEEVTSMALGPGGSVLVFAIGAAVFRWNTDDDSAGPLPRGAGDGVVGSVAVSPDGTLAAASVETGAVNVWHLPSAQRVATMAIPEGPAPVAFSEDGSALRTVDAENVFTEWDVGDVL
ncbi:WD40 repeat domain-containing serine/threonine protein kinase [Nocardiopsis alba]|uniref:WD40 repeat domain-containing serine/threonine protein kinase n=1 Tax=Nocardiopsis alba TaxID=53437 RepID=UPI00363BC5FD